MTTPDQDPVQQSPAEPQPAQPQPAQPAHPDRAAAPSPNRRPQVVAVVALLVAAAALWGASRMQWALVYTEDGLTQARTFSVIGADWSPWLVAVAIFFLAALAVQFVLHGVILRAAAVLVALGGVAAAFPAISLLNSADDLYATRVVEIPARSTVVAVTTDWEPGVVVLFGAVCAVVGAVAMMRSASTGRQMSSKYTSPAARREDLERRAFADYERRQASGDARPAPTEREFWDSLDSGVDPTDDPGDRP